MRAREFKLLLSFIGNYLRLIQLMVVVGARTRFLNIRECATKLSVVERRKIDCPVLYMIIYYI